MNSIAKDNNAIASYGLSTVLGGAALVFALYALTTITISQPVLF